MHRPLPICVILLLLLPFHLFPGALYEIEWLSLFYLLLYILFCFWNDHLFLNDWVYGFCFSICDYCFNFWIISLFDLVTIYYLSLWKVCVVLIIFCVFICFIFINLISFSFVVACLKCYFYFQKKQKIYNIVLIYLSFLYVLAIVIFNWKKRSLYISLNFIVIFWLF